MWQLIKQNISYNKWGYSSTIFFLVLLVFMLLIINYLKSVLGETQALATQDFSGGGLMAVLAYSFYTILLREIKEDRNRQNQLLPISQKNIARARMLFYLMPLLIIFVTIPLISLILLQSITIYLGSAVLIIGFPLVLVFAFIIDNDIRSIVSKPVLKIIIPVFSWAGFILVVFFFYYNIKNINLFINQFAGNSSYIITRMLLFILGVILSFVSLYTFKKRNKFTG